MSEKNTINSQLKIVYACKRKTQSNTVNYSPTLWLRCYKHSQIYIPSQARNQDFAKAET